MARSKAYLFGGVEIRWSLRSVADCSISDATPAKRRSATSPTASRTFWRRHPRRAPALFGERPFCRQARGSPRNSAPDMVGSVDWAIAWAPRLRRCLRQLLLQHHPHAARAALMSRAFCSALTKRGLRAYGELSAARKRPSDHHRARIVFGSRRRHDLRLYPRSRVSVGQTKETGSPPSTPTRLVEGAVRDRCG